MYEYQVSGRTVTSKPIEIDHNALLSKMDKVTSDAEGDIARLIELLLLENYLLKECTSAGFHRGVTPDLSTYPRFVTLVDDSDDQKPD